MFSTKLIEKIKTHVLCSITFLSLIVSFMKECRKMWWSHSGHKWRHNMAHTSSVIDKQGYMQARACTRPRFRVHTQICNTYRFSTVTVVTWTRFNVTLHVHCLSCYMLLPLDFRYGQQFYSLQQGVPIAFGSQSTCRVYWIPLFVPVLSQTDPARTFRPF
jgi:hypothetical protein